jgi:hypothetical protein
MEKNEILKNNAQEVLKGLKLLVEDLKSKVDEIIKIAEEQ